MMEWRGRGGAGKGEVIGVEGGARKDSDERVRVCLISCWSLVASLKVSFFVAEKKKKTTVTSRALEENQIN